ncbi:hypothetical protein J2786_000329 [Chryseobacterium vietnamense]|uniref:Uncharacterized protein n=1 Tax=Chryseobacterium vietnamense TaxID=866785 RepID=A0ACC6J2H9_9FLAO|nr:hypothetical protein [Chryseobacterium vietnamense]MDR6457236.1 hypothetical protein [Chryseobacterium vietnamense]
MAFSKEYTHWHLTPGGWVVGNARIDFSKFFDGPIPDNRVLTIIYEEIMSSPFSGIVKSEEVIYEIDDKNLIEELREKFPKDLCISTPD